MEYPKSDAIVYIYTKDGKRKKGMFFMNGFAPTFASYGLEIKLENIERWEYMCNKQHGKEN